MFPVYSIFTHVNTLFVVDNTPELLDIDAPSYSLSLYDNFTTAGSEDVDAQCSQEYLADWRSQVAGMVATLNNQLASGELCAEDGGLLTVVFSSASFTSHGNEVIHMNSPCACVHCLQTLTCLKRT